LAFQDGRNLPLGQHPLTVREWRLQVQFGWASVLPAQVCGASEAHSKTKYIQIISISNFAHCMRWGQGASWFILKKFDPAHDKLD
jgi:hypothetical protein